MGRLHYVRSHGPVAQLSWEQHRLVVFSDPPELVANPKSWTMDELAGGDFKIFEFPATMACDGSMFRTLLPSAIACMTPLPQIGGKR